MGGCRLLFQGAGKVGILAENMGAGDRFRAWIRSEGARIWIAMLVLVVVCRIVAPGTLT